MLNKTLFASVSSAWGRNASSISISNIYKRFIYDRAREPRRY